MPHAITSKKWLSYWENIEDEKKKKEDKQKKKVAREEKKLTSSKNRATKKNNVTKEKLDQPSTSKAQDLTWT